MILAQEVLNLVNEEKRYRKGAIVIVYPTASGLQKSYPATKWLTKKQKVTLEEPANSGGLDVYDVITQDGEKESIYGFNLDK